MKSADNMVNSICQAIDLVFGSGSTSELLQQDSVQVASAPTLSRATYKLDLMHMRLKRKQWESVFGAQRPVSISLCDSDTCSVALCFVFGSNLIYSYRYYNLFCARISGKITC